MAETAHKPRVALLGAGPAELELLGDLQRTGRIEWVGVYDPAPNAIGLGVAATLGIPAGHDEAARERLRQAEFIVLPHDRLAHSQTVQWASGLHAELLGPGDARRRWGGAGSETWSAEVRTARSEEELRHLEEASARLQEHSELADWLLGIAMRAVGATGGSIQLLAPDTAELYLVAARGLSERVVRRSRHGVGEPISGRVAATRQPQVMEGPQPASRARDRGPITASVCLPLEDADALVGVLNLSSAVRGRRFADAHLETLSRLAPRLAALLRCAERLGGAGSQGLDPRLPRVLVHLEAKGLELGVFLGALAEHLCTVLDADGVTVYVGSEEGEWLRLGGAERDGRRQGDERTSRDAVSRSVLEQRWLHLSEPEAAPPGGAARQPLDAVDSIVERAFAGASAPGRCSRVYAPLTGIRPLGVLVARFGSLETAEHFVQHGEALVQQVGLYLEARVREHRQELRLQRLARLARLVPRLFELQGSEELAVEIARQAALLVGAHHALTRHADETRHTYSGPVAYGLADAEFDAWRRVDAQVSERTLLGRHSVLTIAVESESERLDDMATYRSLISVPLLHRDRIVGVLNVYDKEPTDLLDGLAFTSADRELLESLALVAAPLYAAGAAAGPGGTRIAPTPVDQPGPAAAADRARAAESPAAIRATDPTGAAAVPAPKQAPFTPPPPAPPGALSLATARAFLDSSRARLLAALERELVRAARYHHGVGVSLLRFSGLSQPAGAASSDIQEMLATVAQECVRSSDLVGWWAPEDLVVVTPESHTRNRQLEERLMQVLGVRLERLVGPAGAIDIRVGSSAYPRDGQDVPSLLAAAAERRR